MQQVSLQIVLRVGWVWVACGLGVGWGFCRACGSCGHVLFYCYAKINSLYQVVKRNYI